MKLYSWRYEVFPPLGLINLWYEVTAEKVTAKKIFLAPIDPVRTTRRIVIDRQAIEATGKANAQALGYAGRWPYVFNDAGRANEEARLQAEKRQREAFDAAYAAHRAAGHSYAEWRESYFLGTHPEYRPQDGFSWPSSADEIRRRFRELAKTHHPDVGGDASKFVALNTSYQRALRSVGAM